ncbi:LCP family protein [Kitasatospora sp. NPDC097605]|uniref:LCP family protein n=1 Tax=Kitasatospora sp. NPDC097605 TaxID=3157226 RepID=UPI00333415FB
MSGQRSEGPARGDDTSAAAVPPPRPGGRAEARRAAQGKPSAPAAAAPAPGGRAAARAAARKPKWGAKKIVAWSAAGVLVLLAGTGGVIYFKLNGNIKTIDPGAIAPDRPPEAQADANGNKPVNMLLIGSDSRGGNNSDLGGGDTSGARSDTTILLHVYADHKHAVGISIPRNALVTIPPCKKPDGKWSKEVKGENVIFNAAFSTGNAEDGNPACTQNTVEKLTGIRIDHTMVVDFQGFASMTKAVDGVDVCLPKAIYEGDMNPNLGRRGDVVLPAGRQKVDGQKALDYVRLRHGLGDNSDIGRMKRQQAFLSSMISAVKQRGLSPTNLLPLADAATKSLRVDEGLNTVDKLMSFALSLKNIDLHDIKFVTPPWRFHKENLELVSPGVDRLWETLKADRTIDGQNATGEQPPEAAAPTPAADPATSASPLAADTANKDVKVSVYSGTPGTGLATKAAEQLKAAKFTATAVGPAKNLKYTTTMVQYGSGQKANAEKVAALFPGAVVESGSSAGITVIVGKDFAAANGAAASPSTAGGSSAAPATPAPLPSSVTDEARSADDDICEKIS